MDKLIPLLIALCCTGTGVQAAPAAPQPRASDSARMVFLKKCLREVTKESCTAPPEARAPK